MPTLEIQPSGVVDKGQWPIHRVNEANIPVNVIINEPTQPGGRWTLIADNYKPLQSTIDQEVYELEADSREALFNLVQQYITPLYRKALQRLEKEGCVYFWE